MRTLRIREAYLSTMDRLLFFYNDDPHYTKECEDIFLNTWDSIPQNARDKISENLDFIWFNPIEDFLKKTPAYTLLNEISHHCIVVFDPFFDFLKLEKKVHILAHELAHVFYNHPLIGFKLGPDKEKKYKEEIAEPEANALTQKWRI